MAQKLVRYIEMDEFKKLLSVEKDKEFKLAYALGMGSGLRISEIVGLENELSKCCNVKLEEIKKDIGNKRKKKVYLCSKCKKELGIKDIKRGKDWKIHPLEKEQVDLDKHQIKVLGKRDKERITVTSPWLNKTNIQLLPLKISRRTLQRRFTQLCKKVLGKNLNIHTLRHGFGNYMVNVKKVPIPIVQSMLGHSDISTTGIYTKSNPEQGIKVAWESF